VKSRRQNQETSNEAKNYGVQSPDHHRTPGKFREGRAYAVDVWALRTEVSESFRYSAERPIKQGRRHKA